ALAMAPGFEDALKDAYLNSVSDSSQVDQGFLHQIQQPFAMKTAHALGGLLQAEVKVGEEANESEFKQHAAQYEVIHLGTHTQINNVSPLYSKLILSKSSNEDGYLHAYELYDMQLQAELAVLTACQTGVGQQESSEGVISLAHSFAYAGCPSIIMSLWDVDEQSTAIITEAFYRQLADGRSKNRALRDAKLAWIKSHDNEQNAPYYWAGLVLMGDPDPIEMATGFPWGFVLIGLGLLLAVILFTLMSRGNRTFTD
ncbi:MAG: CHAT domain-containing protein, partial [Flavobacteriales bacterium]|nr:CHAT domain-containing protein [Flavobacteriales bacterium]